MNTRKMLLGGLVTMVGLGVGCEQGQGDRCEFPADCSGTTVCVFSDTTTGTEWEQEHSGHCCPACPSGSQARWRDNEQQCECQSSGGDGNPGPSVDASVDASDSDLDGGVPVGDEPDAAGDAGDVLEEASPAVGPDASDANASLDLDGGTEADLG